MLFFSSVLVWYYYVIFFGGGAMRHLIIKGMLFVVALVFAFEAVRYAVKGEYCVAGLLDAWALLMVIGAVVAL
jgi:hypothetical protein